MLAVGFGLIGVGAAIYLLVTLLRTPTPPDAAPRSAAPTAARPLGARPAAVAAPRSASAPVAPTAPIAPADTPPPSDAENAAIKAATAAYHERAVELQRRFEAGKLSKAELGEAMRAAQSQATADLARTIGPERAKQAIR
jgi:hypothetical protein